MGPKPHRRLTDARWLLSYATENPRRALLYGIAALLAAAVVTVSLAVEAVPVWVGAIVAGLAILAVAREPVGRARLLWAAEEASTGSARDRAEGVVALTGTATAATDRRLTSDLAEVDCLAYEYTKRRSENRSEGGTTTSTRTTQRVLPFYLDDGSGAVLVDARTGTLALATDRETRSGSTRRNEGRIEPGDEVTVYGEVVDGSDAAADVVADSPDEDLVVAPGPAHGDAVVTDRSGRRLLLGQVGYALAWIAVGATLVGAGLAAAAGLVAV